MGLASRAPGRFWDSWGSSRCSWSSTTSLECTARLLGRSIGDDIASFSENDYEHAATLEGGIWNTAQDWVEEKKILEHRPIKIAPWDNLIIIPMIGQIIQPTLFMLLVFGFFMGFASIAISDSTIESWMTVKPQHQRRRHQGIHDCSRVLRA